MASPTFQPFSRRELLKTVSCGFGYLAMAGLCSQQARALDANPLAPRTPHFKPRAKRVIFLFMQGAPSHVDTFDYKPQLTKDDGKAVDGGYYKNSDRKLMKSPWSFEKHGKSGLEISELWPNLASHADDLCLLNSMHTDLPNHPQAAVQLHTGSFQFVRPSMGSWILYGLGTENEELPGFIAINPLSKVGGAQNYGSAFLPASFQGTRIGDEGQSLASATIPNLTNPSIHGPSQRKQLDLVQAMNRERLGRDTVNGDLEGVIESYELAFRMQGAVPELMDLGKESKETLEAYGIGTSATDNFGRQCLLARRFAEAGVRFIELAHPGWDQHSNLASKLTANCKNVDQPIAALLGDLKQRGLLDDTLVVWGGEFGRTPHVKRADGRDHNATGYSMWLAGGGVKGGMRYGATDEHGIAAVEDKM
ncbi:MAG TPA: DUF1501 domain-containing protein, partial [Pirellulales bacterium]|nr:DUF1501 domain-containing protein [Pirellulales bacterium]